jgi:tetratricopeptide (TPR) repeat protein
MMRDVPLRVAGLLALTVLFGCATSPQARRDKYLQRGKNAMAKKRYANAVLDLRNAAKAAPRDPEVQYQLGLAFAATGDVRSAVIAFQNAVALNPKHTGARLELAKMMAATNSPSLLEDARKRLQELVDDGSASSETLNTLALTELKLGNAPADAAQILQQALAQSPGELDSAVMLAWAKWQQKDVKGTEETLKNACDRLPKSVEARRVLARFYLSQGRLPEAEPQLRRALELDPKSGPSLLDLSRLQLAEGKKQEAEQGFRQLAGFPGYRPVYGVFLFQDGRRNEAVQELESALRQNPDDRQTRLDLLIAYRVLDRGADADRLLAEALKNNPKDTDALLQRAEMLTVRGQYDLADADLNAASKLNAATPELHYLRARLHKLRGLDQSYRQELLETLRLNRALLGVRIELAQDFVQNHDGQSAMETLDAALPSQQSSAAWLAARNWALWTKGDLAEMRKGIDAGLSRARNPEFLLQDALWKFRSGNTSGAQAMLQELLQNNPGNLVALQVLNTSYASQNNSPVGLEKVKEYAARVPGSAQVQNFLGQLLLAKGDRAQAKAVLTAAKARAPKAVELDLSLTQIDYLDHKYDDARNRLQAVLAANPMNVTARLWLGAIELKRGDHQAAIQHFREVLDLNPHDANAGNDLAYELAEHTRSFDEALKYAQQAVQMAPNQLTFQDTLGWVLYHKGLYPLAIQYLEQANKDPKDVLAKYHLAMAYAKAGDPRSRATLQAALKLDSRLPEAKMAEGIVGLPR